jgi:hypothetical protein
MEIKRSGSSLFSKGPADWFGAGRFTYPTINALRAVAFLEFGPAMAGHDD